MLLELGLMLEILCCLLNKLPIEGVQFDLLSNQSNTLRALYFECTIYLMNVILHKNKISYSKLQLYNNEVTIFYSGFTVKKSVSSWQYSCVCLVRQNPNFDKVHMAECHFATSILFGPKASQNETFSITDVERNCQRLDEKFTEFKVHT